MSEVTSSTTPAARVVLITGSAQRLGRTMAQTLARAGDVVAVHHHTSSPQSLLAELRALGATADSFAADLADEVACQALVPQVVAKYGRLDAVVHNASRFDYDNAATFTYASMEQHWRANTAPAIVLAQALHTHLSARSATGCVVALLDQKLWNMNPDYLSYTLSKAALEAAVQMLSRALAPHVRVCGVAPGVTLPTQGTMDAATFERAQGMTVLKRSSSPDDVANAVRFVLDSPAITGTTIVVDGGQHLMSQSRDVAFLT